jgi:hypothetical protein
MAQRGEQAQVVFDVLKSVAPDSNCTSHRTLSRTAQ